MVKVQILFLSEDACQYLSGIKVLRSVSSRVYEIHSSYINFHSMNLRRESGVQIDMKQSSGVCCKMEVSNTDCLNNVKCVYFPKK